MNWTPGKIIGTVKPAGAKAPAAPLAVPTVVPVAAALAPVVIQPNLPAAKPAASHRPVVETGSSSSTVPKLQGTVTSQPTGANKIQGYVNLAGSDQPGVSSDQLTRKAVEEIYRDVRIGRVRASQVGALGWRDCPLKKTNKRFLSRTVTNVIQHNNRRTIQAYHKSTRKLIELDRKDDVRYRHRKRRDEDEEEEEEEEREREDYFTRDIRRKEAKKEKKPKAVDSAEVHVVEDDDEMEEGEIRSDEEEDDKG